MWAGGLGADGGTPRGAQLSHFRPGSRFLFPCLQTRRGWDPGVTPTLMGLKLQGGGHEEGGHAAATCHRPGRQQSGCSVPGEAISKPSQGAFPLLANKK